MKAVTKGFHLLKIEIKGKIKGYSVSLVKKTA